MGRVRVVAREKVRGEDCSEMEGEGKGVGEGGCGDGER